MSKKWIEISIITTNEATEPISGIFYGLNLSGIVIEEYDDKNKVLVKGYFSSEYNVEDTINYMESKIEKIEKLGIDTGEGKIICKNVYEEDWENNWKKYYKTTKVGSNIIIKPIWEKYTPEYQETIVEIDPGMAFGTGTHETTKMCIAALEKYIKKGFTVFDIGTGSGILSIVSEKIGANKVIGVDLDPVAVSMATKNVQINNSSKNVQIFRGNLAEIINEKANIVVANILAEVIIPFTEDAKRLLLNEGYFIASGIIKNKEKDVLEQLRFHGFDIIETSTLGEWVCIVSQYNEKEN